MDFTDAELEHRVRSGLRGEIKLFGSSAPTASVWNSGDGRVIASVSPATPERSLFNSVHAADPDDLGGAIDELEALYERSGVSAWTVWLPAGHPVGPALLAPRGHAIDGTPRSMGLALTDLRPPKRELPRGVEIRPPVNLGEIGAVNDVAYGLEDVWRTALDGEPEVDVRWLVASVDGRAVSSAGSIEAGDDACITAVATDPGHRGGGFASALIFRLLSAAAERGFVTATLQASRDGAPVYERLGFRDVGNTEMWERRATAV